MALVWADGFDHYTSAQAGRFYNLTSNFGIDLSGVNSRTGLGCTNGGALTKTVPSQAAYVAGVAANFGPFGLGGGGGIVLDFKDNGNLKICWLSINTLGFLTANYNGGTTTAASAIDPNVYHYFEIKATNMGTNANNGTFVVRVDNIQILNVTGITHANTSGTTTVTCQAVGLSEGAFNFVSDDYYICDTTGGSHNDFLGPISVYTLWPTKNGNTQQWTGNPNVGANEYTNVNEHQADDDTTYNSTSTLNNVDDYGFSNASIPSTQVLQAVGTFMTVRNDLAGAASIAPALEQGGAPVIGSNTALSTAYVGVFTPYDTNPATALAWVLSDINALSAGLKRTV